MSHNAEAARARAEAIFKTADVGLDSAAVQAERAIREKTERLRAARLAQEALKAKGADIRRERRWGV